jgi:hypothetical protein
METKQRVHEGSQIMQQLRSLLFKNRYTVLASTLLVYILVVVVEGAITGREARMIDLDNPFFDLNIREFEEFQRRRQERDAL